MVYSLLSVLYDAKSMFRDKRYSNSKHARVPTGINQVKHLSRILTPNVTRGDDSSKSTDDTEIKGMFGHVFRRNNRDWRVSVITDTFIMGTATDAKLDGDGPISSDDIIRVAGNFRNKQKNVLNRGN